MGARRMYSGSHRKRAKPAPATVAHVGLPGSPYPQNLALWQISLYRCPAIGYRKVARGHKRQVATFGIGNSCSFIPKLLRTGIHRGLTYETILGSDLAAVCSGNIVKQVSRGRLYDSQTGKRAGVCRPHSAVDRSRAKS